MDSHRPTYFLIQAWCGKVFGVDLNQRKSSPCDRWRRLINLFSVFLLVLGQFYVVYVSLDDLDSLCHLLGLLVGVFLSFVKLCNFHSEAEYFAQLNELTTNLVAFVKPQDRVELVTKNKLAQTLSFINITSLLTSSLTLILFPLGVALFQHFYLFADGEAVHWPTPFDSSYPFEVRGFTRYFLVYVFILYNYVICCFGINGADAMFVEACLLLRCHFRVLQKQIERMDYEHFEDELREVFKYHRNILIVKDSLQKSYGKVLPPFMVIASAMFGLFVLSAQRSPGLTVFKSLGYAISTLCQIFFYTYGGSIINEESAAVVDSYYNSNWYTAAPRKRKDLCTAMILAQGGTKIDAGLFELTLNTFARLLSSTFSLITLLASVFD